MHNITHPRTVVGIDVHKYSHTAVALNSFGNEIASLTFTNQELNQCVDWLNTLIQASAPITIALENINSYGIHLSKRLLHEQFSVFYMPPVITDRERRHSTHRIKDDATDAKRIAKAILIKQEEALPANFIISDIYSLQRTVDLLIQERSDNVAIQTRLKNQLHALLHNYYGDTYKQGYMNIFSMRAMKWYENDLSRTHSGIADSTHSIKRRLYTLKTVQESIRTIDKELVKSKDKEPIIRALVTSLIGCGTLTACKIVAEIGDIKRFATSDKLARYSGVAPIPRSSGRSNRVVTDQYGNRKLNQAIHTIALSQISRRGSDNGRAYFERKVSEGKSKLWALRCLKRQVIKAVFRIMTNTT